MHPPFGIIAESFLPSIRGLVAHELVRRKLSQGRVASLMGITQPAISQCLSKSAHLHRKKLQELGIGEQDIERYVSVLCEDVLQNPVEGVQTLLSICRELLSKGTLCEAHRRQASFLSRCNVCMRVFGTTMIDEAKMATLDQLEKAEKMLNSSPFFALIMPEVSVNIVMALEGAKNEADVAAFPGRIVKVKNRAQATMPPEFGASHHMAQMLLTAMRSNPIVRAAINVKYDLGVESALASMGLEIGRTIRNDRIQGSNDQVVESLAALAKKGPVPPVVVDEGSKGIEPMTYLFGRDAMSVAEMAIELSNRYARS